MPSQGVQVDAIPPRLGKYQVLAQLGEGGMAQVFLAAAHGPAGFSKLLVLKTIRQHLADEPEMVSMFMHEARLAGRLNHANIVQTYEVGEVDGRPMLVMEYLDGRTFGSVLRSLERQNRELPLALGLHVIKELLKGLESAHELRDFDGSSLELVHRDVSPQNVFVTYDGTVKVLDFGIAKAITANAETQAGVMKGKVAYMAPEQLVAEPIDRRADIYAVGAMLWHVVVGKSLWADIPQGQVMFRAATGDIPRPMHVNPSVDPELDRICMKALARNPADRYPSAIAMHAELAAFASRLDQHVTSLEMGDFVSELFAALREKIRKAIELKLAETRKSDLSAPQVLTMSGTQPGFSGVMSLGSLASSGEVEAFCGGMTPTRLDGTGVELGRAGGGIENMSVSTTEARQRASPELASRKSKGPMVAAAAVTLLGLAAGVFFWKNQTANGSVVEATTAMDTASVAVPDNSAPADVAVAPQTAEFVISARPTFASIYIGDQKLSANPSIREVPADGSILVIRAEAPGYRPRTVEVKADRSQKLEIELQRESEPQENRPPPVQRYYRASPVPAQTASAKPAAPAPPKATGPKGPDLPSTRVKTDNLNPWAD